MRSLVTNATLGGLFVVLVWWVFFGGPEKRQPADITLTKSTAALAADSALEQRIAQDSLTIVRLTAARDSAVHAADVYAARAPRIVEKIVQVAGDSAAVVEMVDSLVTVHAEEVSELRKALSRAQALNTLQAEQIERYVAVNAVLREALQGEIVARANDHKHDRRDKAIAGGIMLILAVT